jgi:hypothetical protein
MSVVPCSTRTIGALVVRDMDLKGKSKAWRLRERGRTKLFLAMVGCEWLVVVVSVLFLFTLIYL